MIWLQYLILQRRLTEHEKVQPQFPALSQQSMQAQAVSFLGKQEPALSSGLGSAWILLAVVD